MPIYDYHCEQCGEQFEERVAGPRSRPKCPGCQTRSARRLPPRVALKTSAPLAPRIRTGADDDNCAPSG